MAVPITGKTLEIEEVAYQCCEACIASGEYSDNLKDEVKELQANCAVLKYFPAFAKCQVKPQ
jgi:hypothetical protein